MAPTATRPSRGRSQRSANSPCSASSTNTDYLAKVLDHPAFRAGQLHTGFVSEHRAELAAGEPDAATLDTVLIAAALGFREFRDLAFGVPEPHATIGHWRN